VGELTAGRTAGWKRIRTKYPDLTEYHAKRLAPLAKARHEHPLRLAAGQ
jgi:hypothetical protein